MNDSLQTKLETGPQSAPLVADARGYWQKLLTTPLSDLLRGRVTGGLTITTVLSEANLPADVALMVHGIARSTRLWSSEKLDVARELAAHFRDGLDTGVSPEDLTRQFGEPRVIAKLIRRSRLRCRPLWWQAWRYMLLGLGVLFLCYVGLAVRFYFLKPTISRNYIKEFNDQTRATPEDQWAWPIYRVALKGLKPYPKGTRPTDLTEGWWTTDENLVRKDSRAWNDLTTYVEQNQTTIQLIHEAARKPSRGIIYGDPADNHSLQPLEDRPIIELPLHQSQEMRTFARLLSADAVVACDLKDVNRLSQDIHSMLLLAEQCRGFSVIEDLISAAVFHQANNLIRDCLETQPDLLPSQQLIEIAHRLGSYYGGGTIRFDLQAEQVVLDDLLQRCYTDDGHGDGVVTPEGIVMIEQFEPVMSTLFGDDRPNEYGVWAAKSVLSPLLATRFLGRRESKELMQRLLAESQSVTKGPLYTWKSTDVADQVYRAVCSNLSPAYQGLLSKCSLVGLLFPATEQLAQTTERICQVRDGTLTAIALELYRRQQGGYPDNLEQLVPRYLPEPPLDRVTGQTLRYRIQDGKPLIYACGMDQQDDGGRHPNDDDRFNNFFWDGLVMPQKPTAPGEGYDWVLFPRPRQAPAEASAD
jgi:hypothetical protein